MIWASAAVSFTRLGDDVDMAWIGDRVGKLTGRVRAQVRWSDGWVRRDEARAWMLHFVQWYNTEHRHSGLNLVTPVQCHTQEAETVMRQRVEVCEAARARHPRRWSQKIRDWTLPDSV